MNKEPEFFYTFYENVSESKILPRLLGYKIAVYMCCNMGKNTNSFPFNKKLKMDMCETIGAKMQSLLNELTNMKKEYVISVKDGYCMVNPAYFWYGDLPKRKKALMNKEIQDRFNFKIV